MLNRSYIANPHRTGENRLPARSLLIPAQKPGVTHRNFAESDRIELLNGTWRFSYREEDTDEAFYLPEYDDGSWDGLPVPSMWQFHGYGTCFYPNVRYCFPYDPPYIHAPNPVGLYRRSFEAQRADGRTILRFGGVDNAYFVWLNGEYVGFSKGSRIAAEFDVTALIRDGENLLAVKVYTYSDASYLENQDMLMASGIFRDVMLIRTGKNALWDYTLLPAKDLIVAVRVDHGEFLAQALEEKHVDQEEYLFAVDLGILPDVVQLKAALDIAAGRTPCAGGMFQHNQALLFTSCARILYNVILL